MKEIKTINWIKNSFRNINEKKEEPSEYMKKKIFIDGLSEDLLEFDYYMFDNAEQDSISVRDDDPRIHFVGYGLLQGGARLTEADVDGAIEELNELIGGKNGIVQLSGDEIKRAIDIQNRLSIFKKNIRSLSIEY